MCARQGCAGGMPSSAECGCADAGAEGKHLRWGDAKLQLPHVAEGIPGLNVQSWWAHRCQACQACCQACCPTFHLPMSTTNML